MRADRLPVPAEGLSRRQWLQCAATGLFAATATEGGSVAADAPPARGCTLSFSTYAMRGMTLERALPAIAALGYDGVELAVAMGFDAEPARMSPERRREGRRLLADRRLKLTALMENLVPAADAGRHRAELDRLRRVTELARDLAPDHPPLVQTVLGGGTWEEKRNLFRDRLAAWLTVAREARVILAIKPHRGGAMSRPAEAIWLIRQLQEPPLLRMVYDYSHYAFRNMPLEVTIQTALPFTAHIAVKDAVQRDGRVQFLLPGESGTFDYARLLRLFHDAGYRGDVCCEVSSMVSSRASYDPQAAARTCYQNMARAFEQARIPRN
jgi:sugar phosphate isomerase/epimerase